MYSSIFIIVVIAHGVLGVAITPNSTVNNVDCSLPCENTDIIVAPYCNQTTKIEPVYDDCGCLKGYRCCPSACPTPVDHCKTGYEFAVNVTDCCGCNALRCDSCPKKPTPHCIPGCQELETLSDIMNGCHFQSCKTECPQMDEMICSNCHEAVSFKNESLCRCTQQKCVKKKCGPKVELPFKHCALKKWAKTECGCDKQYYDTENYCNRHNAEAAATTCNNKCFENVVRRGKGACGCDKAECVRINEDCKQVFPGWDCPKGSVKVMGSSPCGLDREICVKCEEGKLEKGSCDTECNSVIEDKDVNGCPVERCVRKECPEMPSLPDHCLAIKSLNLSVDKCGCVSWNVGFCIDGDVSREGLIWQMAGNSFYSVQTTSATWPQARDFCLNRRTRLAVIEEPSEEIAIAGLVKGQYHWIGGRCRRNSTGHHYYWETQDGDIPFDFSSVPTGGRTVAFQQCDTWLDGIAFSNSGFDDVDERRKKPFVCEIP